MLKWLFQRIQADNTPNTLATDPNTLGNLPDESIFKILMDVSPWDLVAIGETNRRLRATVKTLLRNPTFLKPFLTSKVKLPARQFALPLQTSTATNVTPPPTQNDPQTQAYKQQVQAYKESVADAITGVADLYLTNKQQLLHGLQALELHQMGGFVAGHLISLFVWYKNNLFVCGDECNQLGLGLGHYLHRGTFTRVGGTGQPPCPWGDAAILGVTAGFGVAPGYAHNAVWTTKGLYVCGNNGAGQLGLGDYLRRDTFTRVGGTGQPPCPWGDAPILGVAAGGEHTAVYTTKGLYVCGSNNFGQLGLGDTQDRYEFTPVLSLGTMLYNAMQQQITTG